MWGEVETRLIQGIAKMISNAWLRVKIGVFNGLLSEPCLSRHIDLQYLSCMLNLMYAGEHDSKRGSTP